MTNFQRGTREYNEATRILGNKARGVLDESVRQISSRYLKGDFFIIGDDGWPILADDKETCITKSRRFRIPRDSFLARRTRREIR